MALGNVRNASGFILGSYLLAQTLGCASPVSVGDNAGGGATNPFGNESFAGAASPPQAAAGSLISGVGGRTVVGAGGGAGKSAANAGKGGAGTGKGGATAAAGKGGAGGAVNPSNLDKFSFFVTSFKVLQELSKSKDGFGGDLRYGETGNGAGLRGADKICSTIAEKSMPGSGSKIWRAFLSATNYDQNGKAGQVNAIDRIGNGPWYDRRARVFSLAKADLLFDRPSSADPAIKNDFPNEDGIPNLTPDASLGPVDNHDFLTGTNTEGKLYGATATCKDWTTSDGSSANGRPRVGHSWPRSAGGMGAGGPGGGGGSMNNWMSALDEAGCAPGAFIPVPGSQEDKAPDYGTDNFVGSGGGYGGFYCFALTP